MIFYDENAAAVVGIATPHPAMTKKITDNPTLTHIVQTIARI
jgi:hypothetical protein